MTKNEVHNLAVNYSKYKYKQAQEVSHPHPFDDLHSMLQQLQNTNVIPYAEMPVQQMPQIPIPQLNPPNLVQVSGNASVIPTTLQSSIAPNTHMIHNQIYQSTPQSPIRTKEEEGVFIMESQTQ